MALKRDQMQGKFALQQEKNKNDLAAQQQKNEYDLQARREQAQASAKPAVSLDLGNAGGDIADILSKQNNESSGAMTEAASAMAQTAAALQQVAQVLASDSEIIRDRNGRAVGARKVAPRLQ
jgi:hypothetical protein